MSYEEMVRELILIEAAVESADMGDKELQNAIVYRLLVVLDSLKAGQRGRVGAGQGG
ncbi:hypothetical protein LJC59_00920 [Desulfovibrio sp. OttesenSCG-928-A18]|nr:hypothetical protein [Desulfovibrio sp. OttesenSCG-928-A18]